MTPCMFEISALPSTDLDKNMFIDVMGRQAFALVYDLGDGKTRLCMQNSEAGQATARLLSNILPGLELRADDEPRGPSDVKILSLYRGSGGAAAKLINDILAFNSRSGTVATFFVPCNESETERFKAKIERLLTTKRVKLTTSAPTGFFGSRPSSSAHMDVYEESEEKKLLLLLLEDLTDTILSGRYPYKVFFAISGDREGIVYKEVVRKHILLESRDLGKVAFDQLFELLKSKEALPYGTRHTSNFIEFYGAHKLNYPISTFLAGSTGSVKIGNYAKDGVSKTDTEVKIEKSALNLGFIISGLPGSGKTREAMAIIAQITEEEPKTRIAIISPTDEWDGFAIQHGMQLIKPNSDRIPINFFACPNKEAREKFYEDLALLISTASDCGPYQNPMEKCLLNAFKCAYSETKGQPNPTFIYNKIEESIVKFHGKVTNTGIKYTKHGENIKAALEELRLIISKEEYSSTKGVSFYELLENGVVFDLSYLSNNLKPYIYALILNQLYAIANGFSTDGDNALRLLICIEEAQMIFSNSEKKENAASKDLEMRIQDFRKRGICMMLMTHNVTNIKPEIRRLCQNKLYLKQAPDVAVVAARDLVFTYAEQEEIVAKLKHLDSRAGAFDFVSKTGDEKSAGDSVFIRTLDYTDKHGENTFHKSGRPKGQKINMSITIEDKRTKGAKGIASISTEYMGEVISVKKLENGTAMVNDALPGRTYTVKALSEVGKPVASCVISATQKVTVDITDSGAKQHPCP